MSKQPDYFSESRGWKTKGNSYKERYVEKECPECGNKSAYEDVMKTIISYKCLRRNCRHHWHVKKFPQPTQE